MGSNCKASTCGKLMVALTAALVLCGCTPLWQGTLQGMRDSVKSPQAQLMAKAPADASNLLYVEAADRAAIHVGVASPNDPNTVWWAAPDGVTLTLKSGRVIATEGLAADLRDLRWAQAPETWAPAALAQAKLIKVIDAFDGTVADTRYQYGFRIKPARATVWGLKTQSLLLIEEVLQQKPALGPAWPGDRYWLDPNTGLVQRAEIYYRPDQFITLLPKTPWAWQSPGLASLQRELAVNREADPLTLRLTLDGDLRLHQVMARLPIADPLAVRVLRRSAVAEQAANQAFLRASVASVLTDSRWPGLPAWQAKLKTLPSNGFLPIAAQNAVRLELMAPANPMLNKGDVLVLGHRQQHITVWDARLAQPCQRDYQPWLPITAYLQACLGKQPVPDVVWLARPDGRVQRLAVAAWNAEPAPWPAPGTHLVGDNAALAKASAHADIAQDFAWALTRDFEGGRAP
ncbi:MAG: YjbF family lipoprotein [Pseudomonadota bacterium]